MPRQERAERTRRQLIVAAATSFDRTGFAMTGLNDVTRPTGISKGALYFHFGSKEQLAEAVMAESRTGLREAIRAARTSSGCPLQYLIDLSHGLAERLERDVVFRAGLRLTDDGALDEELRPDPHPTWSRLIERLLSRSGVGRGLRPEVRIEEITALLAAATAGVEVLARRDRGWLTPRVIARLWQAVLPALVPSERLPELRTTPAGPGLPLPRQHGAPAVGSTTGDTEHGRAGAPDGPDGRPRLRASGGRAPGGQAATELGPAAPPSSSLYQER
ncbi:ScbR family autoregulator-binding transcription factor [Kitasatospora sp. NPDC051853]|uniref:ScbR family autoregulator-binding transcription factor n=1 Tax=Kitasatospora sp. NPDC051853 TaxID=3364058 RepID=UPI00378D92A3